MVAKTWMSGGLAVLVMASGCSAVTDFDFEFADGATPTDAGPDADAGLDGGDDGGPDDGGPFDGGPDDGGPDDGGPDDGGPSDGGPSDGGPSDGGTASCEAPCVTNAVLDFATDRDAPWRYFADHRDVVGVAYTQMTYDMWSGLPAWVETSEATPAVLSCARSPESEACAGVADFLLVVLEDAGTPGQDAALDFTVDDPAVYDIEVHVRLPEGASDSAPVEILVSRNVRNALLAKRRVVTPSTSTDVLETSASLLAGERIVVTIASEGDAPEPLAVNVIVRRSGSPPGRCLFAAPLDSSDHEEHCQGGSASGTSSAAPSPTGRLGGARELDGTEHVEWSSLSLRYGGDFTIDFWMRIDEMAADQPAVLSHESGSATELTPLVELYDGGMEVLVRHDGTLETLSGPAPRDASWHFYRFARDTSTAEIRLCVDGTQEASKPLDRDHAVRMGDTLLLGFADDGSPRFLGGVDDVRITEAALPCR